VEYTATEAAAVLGISADSLRRRIRQGTVQARRDGQGRLVVELPADAGAPQAAPSVAGAPPASAGGVQALQAELQALRAVLVEIRSERDALRLQVAVHAQERHQWHERLREAHVLAAQRPALSAEVASTAEPTPAPALPWWRKWWP
jgi:hypothetical protein